MQPASRTEVKLLTAPYGYGQGEHISLRTAGPVDEGLLEELLKGFSCYPPAIPKIKACLRYSNRYDCVVQAAWFNRQKHALGEQARAIGVQVFWSMHEGLAIVL